MPGAHLLGRPHSIEGTLAGRLVSASLVNALPLQHGLDLCSRRIHAALLLSIILHLERQSVLGLISAPTECNFTIIHVAGRHSHAGGCSLLQIRAFAHSVSATTQSCCAF